MNLQDLLYLQVLVVILTGIIGIGYAYLIYERPFPSNQTSVSVVIGVLLTESFIGIAKLLVLLYLDLAWLWWIILFPVPAYLITGIPQIYVERKKDGEQEKDKKRFDDEL
jgi:hypothetical protein